MRTRGAVFQAFALLAILSMPASLLAAQKTRAKGRRRAAAPQVMKPFTLERTVSALQDVKRGIYTEPALIKQITKDGVAFTSSAENCNRIKEAGGSDSLVEVVRKIAPAPIPEPVVVVKAPPTGDLEISCSPVECEAVVDGKPMGATKGGKLELRSRLEGETSVRLAKEGFVPSESRVRIEAGKTASVHAELKPTRATQETWGQRLRNKALDALGGETGVNSMHDIFATGDCVVWGADGKPYSSAIQMLIRAHEKAYFRTQAGKSGLYEVDYLPTFNSKTNFPEQQARALDAGLHLLNDYQVAALMERMKSPPMTLIAESENPANLDAVSFRAEGSTESFTVRLGADGRPKEILQETPLGPGVRAEYSDYRLEKNSYVPTRMMIVWPSTPRQGISIHLLSFELSPAKTMDARNTVKKRRLWR